MKGFVYLATPYSHPDPAIRVFRYKEAVKFLRWCLHRRDWAYSPIAHTHDAQLGGKLPLTDDEWATYSRVMLGESRGLYVLMLDGWEKSAGIGYELEFAEKHGLPVTLFAPEEENYVVWNVKRHSVVAESLKSA